MLQIVSGARGFVRSAPLRAARVQRGVGTRSFGFIRKRNMSERSAIRWLSFSAASLLVYFLTVNAMVAEAADLSFTGQCPLLLAQADSFAEACLGDAAEYKTYFNWDPEVHYAYIGPAAPGSHFGLGCTLNNRHQIAFLGVYYTLDPSAFKAARNASPAYVDFQGNMGFLINNEPVNFFAVRPFLGHFPVQEYYRRNLDNCGELQELGKETPNADGSNFYAHENLENGKLFIRACFSADGCEPDLQFISLIKDEPSYGQKIVYASHFLEYFVLDDGQFLNSIDELKKNCSTFYAPILNPQNLPYPAVSDLREACLVAEGQIKSRSYK